MRLLKDENNLFSKKFCSNEYLWHRTAVSTAKTNMSDQNVASTNKDCELLLSHINEKT